MKVRSLILAVPLVCVISLQTSKATADDVVINYDYSQKPQVDFSKMPKGPLKVAPFSDKRAVAPSESKTISSSNIEKPIADIVNDALVQAFEAGGAALVQEGQVLTLEGELTELLVTEKDTGIEVTIRTHVTLKKGSQTVFDNVIFGRASAPLLDAAVRATLDKLVNSLILDDYFLMEVI